MQSLDARVHDFLAQKRIAVAGVSRDTSRHPVGNLIIRRLKTNGHEVFPINPHMETFEGERCYPNVQSIPGGVDVVVVITKPDATEQIVRECGEVGVPRIWMHQSLAAGGTSVSPRAGPSFPHRRSRFICPRACQSSGSRAMVGVSHV